MNVKTAHVLANARRDGAEPRVHGNGFLQIDVTERSRVHVWGHPDIPQQKASTPIHDHVFGFTSLVVTGRMVSIPYDILEGGEYEWSVYEAVTRDREDTVLQDTGKRCRIHPKRPDVTLPGRNYTVPPFEFHEAFVSEPTITMMQKDGPTLAQGAKAAPRVLVHRGTKPDNDFSRFHYLTDDLWNIVEEVLGVALPY